MIWNGGEKTHRIYLVVHYYGNTITTTEMAIPIQILFPHTDQIWILSCGKVSLISIIFMSEGYPKCQVIRNVSHFSVVVAFYVRGTSMNLLIAFVLNSGPCIHVEVLFLTYKVETKKQTLWRMRLKFYYMHFSTFSFVSYTPPTSYSLILSSFRIIRQDSWSFLSHLNGEFNSAIEPVYSIKHLQQNEWRVKYVID
jgi:hypothetical protein